MVNVHEIILNLDHIPVVIFDNIFEIVITSMEGKAFIADLSFFFLILKESVGADGFKLFSFIPVNTVYEIEINMVCLKLGQLCIQKKK